MTAKLVCVWAENYWKLLCLMIYQVHLHSQSSFIVHINLLLSYFDFIFSLLMDISQEIRSLVIEKFKEGVKQKDICMHLKLNKSEVSKLIKRFKTTGSVSSRRKGRRGRKSSLSDRDMRKIYERPLVNSTRSSNIRWGQ